jgi:hypothetical protein
VGSFDDYAFPLRAYASKIEDRGDRILIRDEVERISKFQRTYEIERIPLGRALADADDHARPQCRYMIVGPGGNVVRVGTGNFGNSGEFVLDLKALKGPGMYTVLTALYIGGNSVNPEVRVIEHRVAGGLASPQHVPLRQSLAIVPRYDQKRESAMGVFIIHVSQCAALQLRALLIAGGLSLIYGVMRILNLAHGNPARSARWRGPSAGAEAAPTRSAILCLRAFAGGSGRSNAYVGRSTKRPRPATHDIRPAHDPRGLDPSH